MDKPRTVKHQIFIAGLPDAEYRRQQALPWRQLTKDDIPGEPWKDHYAEYLLREDGVIVAEGVSVPLGFVQPNGTVAWTRC